MQLPRLFIGGSLDGKIINISEDKPHLEHKIIGGVEYYRQHKFTHRKFNTPIEITVYALFPIPANEVERRVQEYYA
jgi:hypothetical protein